MQNFENLGEVAFKDLLITPQLVLTKTDDDGENKKHLGLEEVEKYITIKGVYIKEDTENQTYNKRKEIEVVDCG